MNFAKESLRGFDLSQFVDLNAFPEFKIQLVYATAENFMGENIYGDFNQPLLHRLAFEKLKLAQAALKQSQPGLNFIIYDALRPWRIQKYMFSRVKGTEFQSYVADPEKGSLHNYGMALDLSLVNSSGQALDMGTAFDAFTELSQPQFEEKFYKLGQLTSEHIQNRKWLRASMEAGGFRGIPNEWWHFNACTLDEAKRELSRVE